MMRWIASCGIGESFGIAGAAVAYAAVERGMVDQGTALILLAGAWEGLCLGAAQGLVLRKLSISMLRWIAATVIAAVAGYGLSLLGGADGTGNQGDEPGVLLIMALGAVMGLVMGYLMGVVQWLAARERLQLRRWAGLNAIGWMPAMAVIMVAATQVGGDWPLWGIALCGAVSGAIAGLCVGGATRLGLPHGWAASDGHRN